MPEAVIVAYARSPIGRAGKGSLRDLRPDDLTAQVVRAALAKVPALPVADLEDLLLGCGVPEGEHGYNLARVVAVLLGLDALPGTTVNRFCASSVQTTRMAFHAVAAGEGHAFVSAGVEAVSRYRAAPDAATRNPRFADAAVRTEAVRAGAGWTDPRAHGQLPDVYVSMGDTAENVARLCGVSREEMDAFALRSQQLAERARENGVFADEICPVTLPDGTTVDADDGPRPGVTLAALAALQPAFRPDGRVTAGNCCPLNDGAAALVVVSSTRASDLGLRPLGRIVATGVSALSPEIMGLGPVDASTRALQHAGLTMDDVDLVEINEAFAAQVIPSARALGVDPFDDEKLNVHGGAIALGHPFGMTGARITATLVNGLRLRDKTFGLGTMCVAGGQGMAVVVERLS